MNFLDILKEYRIPFKASGHEHCRPGWIQIDCPYCGRDSQHWRMGYNLAFGYLNCWNCGPRRPINILIELLDLPYHQIKKLCEDIEVSGKLREERAPGKLVLPKGLGPLLPPHQRYLLKRRYDVNNLIALWGIQGIGIASRLSFRVFLPIIYRGEVVSWTTRSIKDEGVTRYRSAASHEEKIPHKSLLYGEDYARNTIIINEGPFDVWRIGPGAVCTFGSGYSRAQLIKMSKYPVRVVCFDNQADAQHRARQLCRELKVFPGETYNIILTGKDASDSPSREVERLRRQFLE